MREFTSSSERQFRRRGYNRQDRHNARSDLRRERTPEPVQPRHRGLWDTW